MDWTRGCSIILIIKNFKIFQNFKFSSIKPGVYYKCQREVMKPNDKTPFKENRINKDKNEKKTFSE